MGKYRSGFGNGALAAGWLVVASLAASLPLVAAEPITIDSVAPPAPISAAEPIRGHVSLESAARSLDTAALHWQKSRKCGTCHTNFAYLMARPALASLSPPAPEVRGFIEEMVEVRWETVGPRWDAEVVCAAVTLAMNDRETSGKLHPTTRKALDRMLGLQRLDGSWDWLKCGWPPMESDDHYGVTFAALGIALAPDGYAATPPARKSIDGIRRFLRERAAPSLHHRLMVLWASRHVDGLLAESERRQVLDDLWARELPGGGWAIAGLLDGWKEHKRQDDQVQELTQADGYATGFAVYVARQAGVSADDPRLARGVRWLRTHQRESGRWFTRSPTADSHHFISNAGTSFAVLALTACGVGRSATR